jgi:branched-chain amino acid transport system permease protein
LEEFLQQFVVIVVDGLIYASYLFMVAVGLTVIFGVMKVLNTTHGSLYAFGAYLSAMWIGQYYDAELPAYGGFLILLVAPVVVGVCMGLLIERGILQFLYTRDEHTIVLATFAGFLILEDVIILLWGVDPYFAYQPQAVLDESFGTLSLGIVEYDYYSIGMIGLAVIVGAGSWFALKRTKWGKLLLAVIFDRELGEAMGINVTAVYIVTFILGSILAALGGSFVAPTISVTPGIGVEVIILAFAVVVIGGMGSIPGAMIGALVVGLARALAVHKLPEVELFVIYATMALVLIFRPEGLFAPAKARKI